MKFINWRTLMPDLNMTILFSERFDKEMDYLDRKVPFPKEPSDKNEGLAMFAARNKFALENNIVTQEQLDFYETELVDAIHIIRMFGGGISDELRDGECDNEECPIHGKRTRTAKRLLDF